jgi:hypothetical protein
LPNVLNSAFECESRDAVDNDPGVSDKVTAKIKWRERGEYVLHVIAANEHALHDTTQRDRAEGSAPIYWIICIEDRSHEVCSSRHSTAWMKHFFDIAKRLVRYRSLVTNSAVRRDDAATFLINSRE